MSQNLKVQKAKFVKFLDSLSKVSDLTVLSTIDERMLSLMANSDNTLYVVGSYFEDFDDKLTLNCPSLKKLKNLISLIGTDWGEIELVVEDNNISYKSKGVKFKYHLYDDGIISTPKLTLEKLENFEYDIEFDGTKEFISKLLKVSSNVDASKMYIHSVDGVVHCEIKDETKPNSDVLSIPIKDGVDFDVKFIFSLDNLRIMTFSDIFKFKFNTKLGISCILSEFDGYSIQYVSPSLTK
jgi:hypothetical protein